MDLGYLNVTRELKLCPILYNVLFWVWIELMSSVSVTKITNDVTITVTQTQSLKRKTLIGTHLKPIYELLITLILILLHFNRLGWQLNKLKANDCYIFKCNVILSLQMREANSFITRYSSPFYRFIIFYI